MSVGVLLDAFVIRALLIPALVSLVRRPQLVAAVASDHKNSPSRLCFRPFIRLTFRFRVQPPGSTST